MSIDLLLRRVSKELAQLEDDRLFAKSYTQRYQYQPDFGPGYYTLLGEPMLSFAKRRAERALTQLNS
jgi:hypothetical protein